jgi:hypothetical protein
VEKVHQIHGRTSSKWFEMDDLEAKITKRLGTPLSSNEENIEHPNN